MIETAVVLPCPPLLLAGATGAARVPEVERLRECCLAALAPLAELDLDRVQLIGATRPGEHEPGTLTGIGRRFLPWPGRDGEPLPLSLAVGVELLAEVGIGDPLLVLQLLREDSPPDRCRAAGSAVLAGTGRTALVVMADGSAKRSTSAPGYLDERAAAFDAQVQRALTEGDTAALTALDPELAAQLWAGGRSAWQALAEALDSDGRAWRGKFLYSDDPFGVWYGVARLIPEDTLV